VRREQPGHVDRRPPGLGRHAGEPRSEAVAQRLNRLAAVADRVVDDHLRHVAALRGGVECGQQACAVVGVAEHHHDRRLTLQQRVDRGSEVLVVGVEADPGADRERALRGRPRERVGEVAAVRVVEVADRERAGTGPRRPIGDRRHLQRVARHGAEEVAVVGVAVERDRSGEG
jgi:hypothetical protein